MKTQLLQWGRSLTALAALLTLAGCAGIPSDAGTVRDIYDMKQMLADSVKRQEASDSKITYSLDSLDKNVQSNSQTVSNAVDDLTKRMVDQQKQLDDIRRQLQEIMIQRGGASTYTPSQQGMGTATTPDQGAAAVAETPQPLSGSGPAVQAYNTAVQQFNGGQFDQAREGFRQALEQTPTPDQKVEIMYWQAQTFQKLNDLPTAEATYRKLIEENQTAPRAWSSFEQLAQIRRQAGDLDTALNYYKKIVDIYPEYPNIQRVKDAMAQIQAAKSGR